MSTVADSAKASRTYNAVSDGSARLGERLSDMMSKGSLGAMQTRALRIKERTEGLWTAKASDLAVAVSAQAQARFHPWRSCLTLTLRDRPRLGLSGAHGEGYKLRANLSPGLERICRRAGFFLLKCTGGQRRRGVGDAVRRVGVCVWAHASPLGVELI